MDRYKETLRALFLPLFCLAAIAGFYIVWNLLGLPPQEEVTKLAKAYFDQYGLLTVLVSAVLEGILMAGWYFPGSLVIVLAVVFAGDDIAHVGVLILVTTLGFLVAYTLNFYLGKYGWYKLLIAFGFREPIEKAKNQLATYGPRAIFFTYWHPNLAALTATAAGILHMSFKTFVLYSTAATLVYGTLWAIVGYLLGGAAVTVIGPKFAITFVVLWTACILFYKWKKSTP